MPIRPDVGKLQSIASKLRSNSNKLENERSSINSNVQSMIWKGRVYQHFMDDFRDITQRMRTTANDMEQFARRLEALANQFRQEDLEEERRERERQERERQERERQRAAAAAATAAAKKK
ncbi:WXG100 family type VII secretion target [Paenibacillus xylanexedens]|uniref:Uncharacterized protein YukE n=1 Tax=Paenibacillus xylanexedens TaxID=528191 RepID=A0ABS4RV32_PAEXY|nr:WXG100 family type VII secretion target [Paenibacillus xylanexedens]MBP2246210.1 uncharacterized protein YukE [Paenibacillus xylanexedens]